MKRTFVSIAAGTLALALAGCVVTDENGTPIDGGGVTPPPSNLNQTINITTANGSTEQLTQSFSAGAASPGVARICLTNRTGGFRELTHNFMPQINPFQLGPGSSTCANFPANSRVNFRALAASKPATPSKSLTYNTAILAGGRLDLVWH